MQINTLGWDIGGAHLKLAALDAEGRVLEIKQLACPLWQGLDQLDKAIRMAFEHWGISTTCLHAITMTGELVDLFPSRLSGVTQLLNVLDKHIDPTRCFLFAGLSGHKRRDQLKHEDLVSAASANWLASVNLLRHKIPDAIFLDIGSTTTDIIAIRNAALCVRGHTDAMRLASDELIYTGVVRTPLMALCRRAPIAGEWQGLMAEHFATTADIYRLTGELDPEHDQAETADGNDKSLIASRRRLCRMMGLDLEDLQENATLELARYFRRQQLVLIQSAVDRQLSYGKPHSQYTLVGAGIGRFLASAIAEHSGLDYLDMNTLFNTQPPAHGLFSAADAAPAYAVAVLLKDHLGEIPICA